MEAEKVFGMPFGRVYGCLVAKVERKGRSRDAVDAATCWLTGYSPEDLRRCEADGTTYGDFFRSAPHLNERRDLVRGTVCGVRVEDVPDPLMREIRRLDKIVDELAKGKPLQRVLHVADA